MKKMLMFLPTISYKNFFGGQFRQISRYLGFPEGSFKLFLAQCLPFFLNFWSFMIKKERMSQKMCFSGYVVKLPPEKCQYLEIGQH